LALAKWIVLNAPDCSDHIKSRLHQLFGRLHAAQGSFDQAKPEIAKSIFFSSKCNGAESIATSTGYYSLGDIFLAQGNIENCLAYFDKVVDIWYKYLSALHSRAVENMAGGNTEPSPDTSLPEEPSEAQLTDGYNQLLQVLDNRKRLLGDTHIATGEVEYCLGLFEFFIHGSEAKAAEFMEQAHKIYDTQLGPSHSSTLHVKAVLSLVQQQPWSPHNVHGEQDRGNGVEYRQQLHTA
jgi:tetratricopeptide (TPR) repeat protein